ncbi:MAG: F0F1 ATP synthase subunit A, partial [Halobacteriovoraceae bacterium]|nr:F0F1 ATP synthase subunit A [Halobacteriovoraceae bacterium]
MKKFLLLFPLLTIALTSVAHASGGFTWIGSLLHSAHIHVGQHVFTMILVAIIIAIGGVIYRAKLAKVQNIVIPDKGLTFRNITEAYGSFIYTQCKSLLGEKGTQQYFSFIATTFLVILICNLIGLIPGFLPPTDHLSTTLALGCFSFIYYNVMGVKEQGLVNYLKHFCGPLWYMAFLILPIEIISNLVRPLSLALRLRSNMMGDHMVLSIFSDMAPWIVPIIFMVLGILVSF